MWESSSISPSPAAHTQAWRKSSGYISIPVQVYLFVQGQHPGHQSLLSGRLLQTCIHSRLPSFMPSRLTLRVNRRELPGPNPHGCSSMSLQGVLHFHTCHFVPDFLQKSAQMIPALGLPAPERTPVCTSGLVTK